ncbi:MAG: hypothetical protein A3G33_06840 [Omnitrophica bacterium RIFCSPLOWO2_12_FULL_44_17]|uniref:O-antigen ligase-related domain-containing protein n=1 Tax=Candidatus Danuiimicrobium aquiferis TaxID=1801832 RepID=A0A1G1KYF6_9BACT|nr:MAG: hypothetical protein A3B72_07135 [Omnitrophica bacterium RIFCSPHIGHO2_02_FULL_45_28]OGW88384.1 MAG: hypothetical protein A3E74_05790 [Omnitrophica bacterium RIFCSPHIGHO2_12_FULL_44_12]OGW97947.1 MAG: hypothetical protein A3G33_06840 [Omnitrophica bacterium RIFCSPLOWO2_12_FULL_44_17]OGX04222.1 MAG: hypothetical protein A3J12_11590 [Omnitrophica bacterium RIFCSPLOWO2_02_FULL_44_11]
MINTLNRHLNRHIPVAFLVQRIILLTAISLTILCFEIPIARKLGWLLFSLIVGINPYYALYAAFFYAAFFFPSEFFPGLFFTIKHFHIAIIFCLVLFAVNRDIVGMVKANYKKGTILYLLITMLLISGFAGLAGPEPMRVLKTNANILSVLCACLFLIMVINSRKVVQNAILFLSFGTAIRILHGAIFSFTHAVVFYPKENLLHNNHIGFLAVSNFFLLLPTLSFSKNTNRQIAGWACLCVIFCGIILSCSRTGWVSFVIISGLYAFLYYRFIFQWFEANEKTSVIKKLSAIAIFCLLTCFILVETTQEVRSRFFGLIRIVCDPSYWAFTLNDQQNFGFLGHYRLNQFYVLAKVMPSHWLIGNGFIKNITDIHSLYLSILGASGIIGALLFLSFSILWLKCLYRSIGKFGDAADSFRIGTLCAFCVWLIYSVMETFVVQFNLWVIVALGLSLSGCFDTTSPRSQGIPNIQKSPK